jgi:cytochrome c biogenesis protein CcmG, thiol:disulfide interchange protein DsbE
MMDVITMYPHGRSTWFMAWCAAALCCANSAAAAKDPPINVPAPNFHVTTFDGQKLSLEDFKGKVLVLNFWATWCAPCRQELPLLDGYFRAQEPYGLRVLAVTTEDSAPLNKLKPLAAALKVTMARYFRGKYNTLGAVPTNYIIDRKGVLRYAKAGAFTLDDLNDLLVPMLNESGPEPVAGASGH